MCENQSFLSFYIFLDEKMSSLVGYFVKFFVHASKKKRTLKRGVQDENDKRDR